MVVDTSALVAILFREPDARSYAGVLDTADQRVISTVTRVELSLVVEGRKGDRGRFDLESSCRTAVSCFFA
jgi:ribonuclease VapC